MACVMYEVKLKPHVKPIINKIVAEGGRQGRNTDSIQPACPGLVGMQLRHPSLGSGSFCRGPGLRSR